MIVFNYLIFYVAFIYFSVFSNTLREEYAYPTLMFIDSIVDDAARSKRAIDGQNLYNYRKKIQCSTIVHL